MSARSLTAPERTSTALRLNVDQLAEINRRAELYRMTRTGYMIAASLGELPDELDEAANRFEALEARMTRLEQMADLGI